MGKGKFYRVIQSGGSNFEMEKIKTKKQTKNQIPTLRQPKPDVVA